MHRRILIVTVCFFLLFAYTFNASVQAAELIEVATSPRHIWNGVAVSPQNRVFVNFPRWLEDDTPAVGEILSDGSIQPFPGNEWNLSSLPASEKFVNVNSLKADNDNYLWVVDSGAPHGVVIPGGAKLVQIDLNTNEVIRVYHFDNSIAPKYSYVDDVRLDEHHAYLSEAGVGAIIVLDLESGKARRVLENHPSTHANPSIVPMIEGKEFRDQQGKVPQIHVNDIELSPDGKYLYYQSTAGPNLYRIQTKFLVDEQLSDRQLGERVELVGKSIVVGGMTMDFLGNLYLSDVENNAIRRRYPNGNIELFIRDERIHWPDASCLSQDGYLYFPAAQINRMPAFNNGIDRTEKPYRLYKVKVI
ncbi:L-dopachrome tautomerase-related protein [Iningainema tapete]|uniref:Major royal jelly protein n=1 Tax=Iningainema tapete BLCC-T55 TaxID=2748662 RepID=A0A8J6XAQ2_9CYAN|nr:L-dopachrome tautomerase-related protein [Iningainema tapete]MBD2770994.1 hypothetical protein [Iningainema tapete BLCC-T55]